MVWTEKQIVCSQQGCEWTAKSVQVGPVDVVERTHPRIVHGHYKKVADRSVLVDHVGNLLHDEWDDGHAAIWETSSEPSPASHLEPPHE